MGGLKMVLRHKTLDVCVVLVSEALHLPSTDRQRWVRYVASFYFYLFSMLICCFRYCKLENNLQGKDSGHALNQSYSEGDYFNI